MTPKVRVDTVPPDFPGAIAYYDPGKSTVYIDAQYLTDINLPLREYAHAVLYADGKFSAIDYEKTWTYVGIESGLASYFSSSFVNDPRVPGGAGNETLDNTRNLKDMKPSPRSRWTESTFGVVPFGNFVKHLARRFPINSSTQLGKAFKSRI